MKYTITLLALFLSHFAFGQYFGFYPSLVEENSLGGKGIRSYTVSMQNLAYESHYTNGLVLEHATFDEKGNKTFHYRYNLDVVNNSDSLFYTYDKAGKLIGIREISTDMPVGREQIELSASVGGKRSVAHTQFQYNEQDQLIQKTFFLNQKVDAPEIELYEYNEFGLLSKKEMKAYLIPERNNYREYLHYDSLQRLIRTDQVYLYKPQDTLRSTRTYDTAGNLIRELKRTNAIEEKSSFQYDSTGLMTETASVVHFSKKYKRIIQHYKHPTDAWTEEKEYIDGKLKRWTRYLYNEDGLKTEEHELKPESGYLFRKIVIAYERKKRRED